jgi:serine/threonine-protein kinase
MSPEQATAEKEITARSDIYSIGSVLYEMLTGNPPFVGAVAQQIIMKIITEPAEAVTKYRKAVPANVAAAVAKALEKLPADRFESAKAFAEALGNPAYTNSSGVGARGYAASASRLRVRAREAIAWVLAASGIAAAGYTATRHEPPPVAARLIAELPDSVRGSPTPFTHVAISRDGRRLAFVGVKGGTQMVYARSIDDLVLAAVRGSEGAASVALSPDGEWLAFGVRGRGIFKLPVLGGTPQLVADTAGGYSPGWGESGEVVFRTLGGGLLLAPADGSKPRRLLALDSAGIFDAPSLLPGGRDVLVSRGSAGGERGLVLVSTADGRVTDLNMAGFGGSYSAGRVVFSRPLGMVFSAAFSLSKRAFTGPATLLLQGVGAVTLSQGSSEIAVAGNGTLVYMTGGATDVRSMVTVDRQGVEQPLSREDRLYGEPRVSPDGKRIVVRIGESSDVGDVWIYDVGAGSLTPLTTDKRSLRPEWSRDGARIITTDNVSADSILVQSRPWDGNGGVQTMQRGVSLLKGAGVGTASIGPPHGWSAFRVKNSAVGDIVIAPTDSLQALRPFVATPTAEEMPRVSPNGRLVAYSSSKSGRNEVYLRLIPGPGPEVTVSTGWGQEPVWSSDGASLFYRGFSRMMVATITERPAPAVTKRDSLFVDRWDRSPFHGAYDVFPDGKRFVMTRPARAGSEKPPRLFVVVNWPQLAGKQGGAADRR